MKVSNTLKTAIATGLTVAAGMSHAAAGSGVDTAPIVSSLTDAGAAVGVIGAAVLGVVVIVKTFKYIRQAF